jgi:hypothetical protein
MDNEPAIIDWLLKGDPAIRWQVQKDIFHGEPLEIKKERLKTEKEGWGKLLLEKQDAGGGWGGGIYTPKWTSATYTMLLLRQIGLPPANRQVKKTCSLLIDSGFYRDGGICYWRSFKHSETCVTGMILSILCYFGFKDKRIHSLAEHLMHQQMEDGGWNCRSYNGDNHGSFHTTISVLEGFKYYLDSQKEVKPEMANAISRAHEFLLVHRLYKSDKTGKVVDYKMTSLSFPPQWHYDILRCLDYFQSVNAPKDERMSDAIELLISKRLKNGTWPLQYQYPGHYYFNMEFVGKPSRWNTLRAMRVLHWWLR